MNRLQGKRALITGGSRGIGAAIAKRLAADGADVAITYEKSAERAQAVVAGIEALGRRAVAIQADSADPVAVRDAVDRAAEAFGGLDILVNNAGIFRAGALDDLTLDDIDATLNVNVRAVIVASQAAARLEAGRGRQRRVLTNTQLHMCMLGEHDADAARCGGRRGGD